MRILAAIPHYFDPIGRPGADGRPHGSTSKDPAPRVEALAACLSALHQHFGPAQCVIDIAARAAKPVNGSVVRKVDVVVCTAGDRHLLGSLPPIEAPIEHRPTDSDPLMLGFSCRDVFRERFDGYDYFCYLEDDLIVRDPLFFDKLRWFNSHLGDGVLLQPNRFEVGRRGPALKAYLDGDLRAGVSDPYQNIHETPGLRSDFLGRPVRFARPSNPHSGCYFLNARQMQSWAGRSDFLDRSIGFVGPLESAATLGIMKAFRVYKPAPENASFLEIEHAGTGFLGLIRRADATGR